MRIVAVRDIVSPIRSNIANAYIDFSQMTASVVAVETDVKVEGKPVIGYGFNSNGRYGQGKLMRASSTACRAPRRTRLSMAMACSIRRSAGRR